MISLPPATHMLDPKASVVTEGRDLKQAAQKFEAIFIRQMLAAARKTDFGGEKLFGGPGLEQFNAMQDDHLAEIASGTGAFGFANTIEAQLSAQTKSGG
ncbi:MAG: rod-binding protein [Pontixanthobacter sp.]